MVTAAPNHRAERAYEMRRAGDTYDEIASKLGYSSRQGAHQAVQTLVRERGAVPESKIDATVPVPPVGTPISIRAAARKYGLTHVTIVRWLAHPDLPIRVLSDDGERKPKMVDEHDIAVVVRRWRGHKASQGKRSHIEDAAKDLAAPLAASA